MTGNLLDGESVVERVSVPPANLVTQTHAMDDRRQGSRIQTVFRSNLSSAEVSLGQGTVLDVSTSGCRVKAEIPVGVNDTFRMQLFLPVLPWPVQVEQARVKWVSGQEFGCQFIAILPEERTRLLEGLEELERGKRQ